MRWFCLVLLFGVTACRRTAPDASSSEVGMRLRIAERQWDQRARNGLGPVEKTLEAVYGLEPDHSEVLWQLARLKIVQGLLESDRRAALYSFAEARALALHCLDAQPAFLQRRVELGWEPALELVSEEQLPCAAYGALAWARWLEVHGGAAGEIDLDTIDLLVRTATRGGAERERRVAVWAQALVMALRPDWRGQDLREARALLERAIRVAPEDLVRRADLVFLVAIPLDDDALTTQQIDWILASDAMNPEDQRAQERVRAYLEALVVETGIQGERAVP
jgi:hypothetical protein